MHVSNIPFASKLFHNNQIHLCQIDPFLIRSKWPLLCFKEGFEISLSYHHFRKLLKFETELALNFCNIFLPIRIIYAKLRWIWLSSSWEEIFLKCTPFSYSFEVFSALNRDRSFISAIYICLTIRMLYAKFGWNWISGFREEVQNVKSLQTDGRTDRRTTDKKWSE